MARFGTAPQGRDPLAYVDSRLSGVPTVDSNRDPTVNDTNYPIQTIWRNSVTFRECMLVGFTSGDAIWRCFTDGDGTVLELRTDDNNLVQPNSGIIDIDGETVLSGVLSQPVFTNGATANTTKIQVQLGTTVSPTPADFNSAGLLCANINQFDVDPTSGMFSLKGGTVNQALQQVDVNFNTAPGTDPVVPDANGQIQIFGNSVSNGTNANAPVATHSRALNQFHVDVQLGDDFAPTPANPFGAGLLSMDTRFFSVDSNAWTTAKTQVLMNGSTGSESLSYNLGITYTAGTGVFKVNSADGTDMSATNPAYVVTESNVTPGQKIITAVTANQQFIDSNGTSDIVDNLFGFVSGDNNGTNDIPFFLYVALDSTDANPQFFISRVPGFRATPSTARISEPGATNASTGGSFFALGNITPANYNAVNCTMVGCLRMRFNQPGGADDWTVQDLGIHDGIGSNYDMFHFTLNPGVLGAPANSIIKPNGGTAPEFSSITYRYAVTTSQFCEVLVNAQTDGGTDGLGAVNSIVISPYVEAVGNGIPVGQGRVTTPTYDEILNVFYNQSLKGFGLGRYNAGTFADVQNADFTNGTRRVTFGTIFNIGTTT